MVHDIKMIRANPADFDRKMNRRGINDVSEDILYLDKIVRILKESIQYWREIQNTLTRDDRALGQFARAEIRHYEYSLKAYEGRLHLKLSTLPNLPADDVPDGRDERSNIVIRVWP